MKFYDESRMADRRSAFEAAVLPWSGVRPARMFGTPCYNAKGKLFAFLVTDGVVVTNLPEEDRAALARDRGAAPFNPMGRAVARWSQVPFRTHEDLDGILPYVRKSFTAAGLAASPPKKKTKRGPKKTAQVKSRKRPRT